MTARATNKSHEEIKNYVEGFLYAGVNRKITFDYTVNSVTEILSFLDTGVLLFQYTLIYVDSTKDDLLSIERTL